LGMPPESMAEAAAVAESTLGAAPQQFIRISGSSFQRMPRRSDCATAVFDDPSALRVSEQPNGSSRLRCWNVAEEIQIVGAARQILFSSTPMHRSGTFRMDFRVVGGVEAESAHYLEVGLCSEPAAGARLGAGESGIGRPRLHCEEVNGEPFFRFVAVPELLLEGVRLVAEVDFDAEVVHLRNLPEAVGTSSVPPTPISSWLRSRDRMKALMERPHGESTCELFKHQAEHLHDLIDRGQLYGDLAQAVISDRSAGACVGRDVMPERFEDLHFYLVLPAGMEVEIF